MFYPSRFFSRRIAEQFSQPAALVTALTLSRDGDKSRCTPIPAKPYESVQRLLSPSLVCCILERRLYYCKSYKYSLGVLESVLCTWQDTGN